MAILNSRSPVPLYYQLKEYLKAEIIAGRLQVGDRLQPERELAEGHGISRMTVRQALNELEQEGYLSRRAGCGTFITIPSSSVRISSQGFTTDMTARGLRPGTRLLSFTEETATPQVASDLKLAPPARVLCLERLRMADGEIIAHQVSYLSSERFPGLLQEDMENASLYAVLRERYGVVTRGGRRTVESIGASPRDAQLMKIPVGAPLLLLAGVALDEEGVPVETGWAVYRSDRFKLTVEMI